MKLSVIIVNYNVKYFTEQCICSLKVAATNIAIEIFVADNCSEDRSTEYLYEKFPGVQIYINQYNKGFAEANNEMLKLATGEFILFLNPDTILPENVLTTCINFFEKHENVGATGVRMIDGSGIFLPESKRSFPSPMVSFFKLTGLSSLFPKSKIFGKYALGYLNEDRVHEVDVLSGAFMMIPKKVLDTCGSFDEAFFMYGEDIDLSYRIQKAGFQNYYLGEISIVHFKGESTKRHSLNYVRMFFKAMSIFVKKHYHGGGAWLMNASLQVAISLRTFIAFIKNPFQVAVDLSRRKRKNIPPKKVLIVGGASATDVALIILMESLPNTSFETASTIEPWDMKGITADEVILCPGELTYREAMFILEKLPKHIDVKWFGPGTSSIVGSSHKNFQGDAYFSTL